MHNDEEYLSEQIRTFTGFTERLEDAKRRAAVDVLTGLASRAKGEAFLYTQLQAGQPVTVFLIDLDGFKQINVQLGHRCGDQILRSVGEALTGGSDRSDVVCRWGGDKFLKITKAGASVAEGETKRLRALLSRKYEVTTDEGSFQANVSVSVGVAQANDGDAVEDLLARTEDSLRSVKDQDRQGAYTHKD